MQVMAETVSLRTHEDWFRRVHRHFAKEHDASRKACDSERYRHCLRARQLVNSSREKMWADVPSPIAVCSYEQRDTLAMSKSPSPPR